MERGKDLSVLLRQRAEGFARFAEWEVSHPPVMTAEAAIATISAMFELLPPASRRRPVDPTGVHRMHQALRHLR
jgi:hypothetical protein